MPKHTDLTYQGTGNDQMNNFMKSTMNNYKNTRHASGHDVEEIRHRDPGGGRYQSLTTNDSLMTFTQMLEAMDQITTSMQIQTSSIDNQSLDDNADGMTDEQRLIEKLNQLFTPVLIMQGYENNIAPEVKESYSQANVLTEHNVIKFDNSTRMAQLISICAILLQQQKNTSNYQLYIKASKIRNQAKINMQKEEYENAKMLAQKYLVNVSTMNSSAAARNAATALLPETQH